MTKNNSDFILEAAIQARIPIALVGEPGTSKTATIIGMAELTNKHLVTIVPSRMDAQDLSGFPTKGTYTYPDGSTTAITEYAPQLWQKEIMEKKDCILFLDEFSNAHPSVRASLLSFIQDRQFPNGDRFPEGTSIVIAMNPTESAADGYELDPATTNRIIFHAWKPSVESWLQGMPDNWGRGVSNPQEEKWRNLIVRFISDNPGDIHMRVDEQAGGTAYGINSNDSSELTVLNYAWASRRSWDNLSKALSVLTSKNSMLEDTIMSGTVGYQAASHFRDWLRKNGALDIKSILKDPRAYNGWAGLSLDDMNLVLRSAIDSVDHESSIESVRNIVDIFRLLVENDKTSSGAPYLKDFSLLKNKSKAITAAERKALQAEMLEVATGFSKVSVRRN